LTQLKVAADLDPKAIPMRETYKEALACEVLRGEVFAGRRTPLLFGKPAEWMATLVQALQLMASGKFEEAAALRDRAFEDAPATSGRAIMSMEIGLPSGTERGTGAAAAQGAPPIEQPFAWIADADPRLGPVLEAIINAKYYWIPFSRLREIRIEKPVDLRDVAWMPAQLMFANGGETVALIPTRYPGSEAAPAHALVMARGTEWIEHPAQTFLGLGQRLLATDQGELGLMDVRLIKLDSVDDGGGAAVPSDAGAATEGSGGEGPPAA
jgi:type VI secretion system protein ImpE